MNVVNVEYRTCNCSNKHVPKPHKLFKVDIDGVEYFLCPTSFYNLTTLLGLWESGGGEPPGSIRKHFSDYLQRLAKLQRFS